MKVAVLVGCVVLMAGVVVSFIIPWLKERRERERISRGDY